MAAQAEDVQIRKKPKCVVVAFSTEPDIVYHINLNDERYSWIQTWAAIHKTRIVPVPRTTIPVSQVQQAVGVSGATAADKTGSKETPKT